MPTHDNDKFRERHGKNTTNNKLLQMRSKNHFSLASSLSSSGPTNHSRALLERGGTALNRAPTPSTVITRAPPTLDTSAGDGHHKHANGCHDHRKRSDKQKK